MQLKIELKSQAGAMTFKIYTLSKSAAFSEWETETEPEGGPGGFVWEVRDTRGHKWCHRNTPQQDLCDVVVCLWFSKHGSGGGLKVGFIKSPPTEPQHLSPSYVVLYMFMNS